MAGKNAADWLAGWVEDNLEALQREGDAPGAEEQVLACRADAEKAGIPIEELERAAGGNLEAHLLNARNDVIGGEIRRAGETEMP